MTKENKGQDFKDLDLLSKLLASRPSASAPMIEVLSTDHTPDSTTEDQRLDTAMEGEKLETEEEMLIRKTQQMSLEREEILKGTRKIIIAFQSLKETSQLPKTIGSFLSRCQIRYLLLARYFRSDTGSSMCTLGTLSMLLILKMK